MASFTYILGENSPCLDDVAAKRLIEEGQNTLQQFRGSREELEQRLQLCKHGEAPSCRKMTEIEDLRKQISSIDIEINDYEKRVREAIHMCEATPAPLEKGALALVKLSNILGIGLGVLLDL